MSKNIEIICLKTNGVGKGRKPYFLKLGEVVGSSVPEQKGHPKMRLQHFRKSAVIKRVKKEKLRLRVMVAEEAEEDIVMMCDVRLRTARKELEKLNTRSRAISATTFNLNCYSQKEAYLQFRFRQRDISKIVDLCG